jgi:hypothetical protein
MAQLFSPRADTVFKLVLACLFAAPLLLVGGLMLLARSPLATLQFEPIEQPVPFDHRHHAGDERIDCRYCHRTAESSPYAGIPSTDVCMGCHAQIWPTSPTLGPVRASFFQGSPIAWTKVHRLPDFVYFDHSIHVSKGVGCVSCHGRVDEMAAVERVAPLTMQWCLDCHRDPGPSLRPQEAITKLDWSPRTGSRELAEALLAKHQVHTRTDCTTCHR